MATAPTDQLIGTISGGYEGDYDVAVHRTDAATVVSIEGTDDLIRQRVEIPAWALSGLLELLAAAKATLSPAELDGDL